MHLKPSARPSPSAHPHPPPPTCVVLPHPVSPAISTTWLLSSADTICSRKEAMGSASRPAIRLCRAAAGAAAWAKQARTGKLGRRRGQQDGVLAAARQQAGPGARAGARLHLRLLDALLPQPPPPLHLRLTKRRGVLLGAAAAAPLLAPACLRLLLLLLAVGACLSTSCRCFYCVALCRRRLLRLILAAAAGLPCAVRILQIHVPPLPRNAGQLRLRGRVRVEVGFQGRKRLRPQRQLKRRVAAAPLLPLVHAHAARLVLAA